MKTTAVISGELNTDKSHYLTEHNSSTPVVDVSLIFLKDNFHRCRSLSPGVDKRNVPGFKHWEVTLASVSQTKLPSRKLGLAEESMFCKHAWCVFISLQIKFIPDPQTSVFVASSTSAKTFCHRKIPPGMHLDEAQLKTFQLGRPSWRTKTNHYSYANIVVCFG